MDIAVEIPSRPAKHPCGASSHEVLVGMDFKIQLHG